jgi:hypothetical protein
VDWKAEKHPYRRKKRPLGTQSASGKIKNIFPEADLFFKSTGRLENILPAKSQANGTAYPA